MDNTATSGVHLIRPNRVLSPYFNAILVSVADALLLNGSRQHALAFVTQS